MTSQAGEAIRPGARIAWRSEGPLESDAPGDPVLMIMGLGASSRLWYRLLPWIRRRHRAILVDNRGTGDSSPVRSRLTMRDMAEDAVAVLDAAEVESANVVGASMGGMIAQHVALLHPERLDRSCSPAPPRAGVAALHPGASSRHPHCGRSWGPPAPFR